MSRRIVVYDACVLYPAPLRDLLMRLATADLVRAHWTDAIHEEWMRGVLATRRDLTRQQLERTRNLMDAHAPGCLVTGYEGLIPTLALPDADDRHVLAAAIHVGADSIITFNGKDFPASVLGGFGITARCPDDWIAELIRGDADVVVPAARAQRRALKNPPKSVDDFLAALSRAGLPQAAALLSQHAAEI